MDVSSTSIGARHGLAPPLLTTTPPDPFIAVGLLSAGASTAKSANASIGVWRRSQLRTSFAQYAGGAVALRFLLAPSSLIPASDPTAVAVSPALLREANAHRDMLFLNMTEGLYRCTFKYVPVERLQPVERPLMRHAMHTPCTCHARAMHMPCTRHAHAMHMRVCICLSARREATPENTKVPRVAAARADALPPRALLRARR